MTSNVTAVRETNLIILLPPGSITERSGQVKGHPLHPYRYFPVKYFVYISYTKLRGSGFPPSPGEPCLSFGHITAALSISFSKIV